MRFKVIDYIHIPPQFFFGAVFIVGKIKPQKKIHTDKKFEVLHWWLGKSKPHFNIRVD